MRIMVPLGAPIRSVAWSMMSWNRTAGSLSSFSALLIWKIAVSFFAFLWSRPTRLAFSIATPAKFAITERSFRSVS